MTHKNEYLIHVYMKYINNFVMKCKQKSGIIEGGKSQGWETYPQQGYKMWNVFVFMWNNKCL